MTPREIKSLAVFDLCDTLYAHNTTFEFVRYAMRGARGFSLFDFALTDRRSPVYWCVAAVGKLAGVDYHRRLYLRFLCGWSRSDLEAMADCYVVDVLEQLKVTWTHSKLKEALADGEVVYICSSSIDCVVEAVARRLGTCSLSSRLEYHNDVCAGKLANDLTGRKKDEIIKLEGLTLGVTRIRVFTDNLSDIDLVRMSDDPTVIIPRGGREEKWAGCTARFVYV